MNVYFVDRPLTGRELGELGRILASIPVPIDQRAICQYRVPGVLPTTDNAGRFALALPRYIPLLRTHFLRAGARPGRSSPHALLLPSPPSPLAGVLAMALREASKRTPHLILRGPPTDPGLRLIDTASSMRWRATRTAPEPPGDDPRGIAEDP